MEDLQAKYKSFFPLKTHHTFPGKNALEMIHHNPNTLNFCIFVETNVFIFAFIKVINQLFFFSFYFSPSVERLFSSVSDICASIQWFIILNTNVETLHIRNKNGSMSWRTSSKDENALLRKHTKEHFSIWFLLQDTLQRHMNMS